MGVSAASAYDSMTRAAAASTAASSNAAAAAAAATGGNNSTTTTSGGLTITAGSLQPSTVCKLEQPSTHNVSGVSASLVHQLSPPMVTQNEDEVSYLCTSKGGCYGGGKGEGHSSQPADHLVPHPEALK